MSRSARSRVLAAILSLALFFTWFAIDNFFRVDAEIFLGASDTVSAVHPPLGWSEEEREDPRAPEELDDPSLGQSDHLTREGPIVRSFGELESLITGTTGDLYISMGADIAMENHIYIDPDRKITLDGLGKHTLDQVWRWRFGGYLRSEITLKNMTIIGHYYYGIIQHLGEWGKAIFDNVTYYGPQPYYSSASYGEMIIRNGGDFWIRQADDGYQDLVQEFNENPFVVFDGGTTTIRHAQGDKNPNAVFFMTNGGNRYIKLRDEAKVSVTTESYFLYSTERVLFELGDNTRLEVVAAGFGHTADHRVGDFVMGKGAYFSYRQKGTSLTASEKYMYINGNLTMGEGSTFLYESAEGLRAPGKHTLNAPELVSIYGSKSAFYNSEGTWAINHVNAVNYWTTSGKEAPAFDAADNWPDYLWNTWETVEAANGERSYRIGAPYSFSGSAGKGVLEGGEISDALGRTADTLKSTLRFDTSAKRLVLGNLTPFEVEKVNLSRGGIYGSVDSGIDNVMVRFENPDGEPGQVMESDLPLLFEQGRFPKSGGALAVVANKTGLRAGGMAQASGALELVAVPERIYYGEHDTPSVTTLYERRECSLEDENGNMLVQVLDSRGDLSASWDLVLEVLDVKLPDKKQLPASALVFLDKTGKMLRLDQGAVPVYNQGKAIFDYAQYDLIWEENQGLLARVTPGALEPGEYAAVLSWSVQSGPNEA